MRKSVHTPEYAALREELSGARRVAGLSQRDLAARLKVPHSWIAKVESGERRIDLIEFCWFVSACGGDPVVAFAQIAGEFATSRVRRGAKGGGSI